MISRWTALGYSTLPTNMFNPGSGRGAYVAIPGALTGDDRRQRRHRVEWARLPEALIGGYVHGDDAD